MGLIKQIDDQMGRLFAWMEERGLMENTMIVFTSDHGDYLGDHWMGEKDLFHDTSVKVPLIVYDPARRSRRDPRRKFGASWSSASTSRPPSCAISAAPSCRISSRAATSTPSSIRRGAPGSWRRYAISEYDYATRPARQTIGNPQEDARLLMIRDARWKYIHAEGFRPMLFDLEADPDELCDLGASGETEHAEVRARLHEALFAWARRHHCRITLDPATIERITGGEPPGILIGFWDEAEYEAAFGKPFEQRP